MASSAIRRRMSRPVVLMLLLVIASALIALALFVAGAMWRARMTSSANSVDIRGRTAWIGQALASPTL